VSEDLRKTFGDKLACPVSRDGQNVDLLYVLYCYFSIMQN